MNTVNICRIEGPADKLLFAAQCFEQKDVYPHLISLFLRVENLIDLQQFLSTLKIKCQRENFAAPEINYSAAVRF